ncbi:MAG: glycosyltransferase family 2 protein [Rubricoccaceae bacterium]
MPSPPPIAIGLPVYNGARYLEQTLADLLGQTFGDFDLIVCDNASTDETEAIVRDAAARDRRVRYFRHARNLGALPNANFAFAQARSPRYVLASHDDRRHPAFLERLNAALEARPAAVLAHAGTTLIDAHDVPMDFDAVSARYTDAQGRTYAYDRTLDRDLGPDAAARFAAVLRASDINGAIHGLFRSDVFARVGHMSVEGSDRLVLARAALAGPWAYVDAPLFGYRIHEASTLHLSHAERLARESGAAPDTGSGRNMALLLGTFRRYVLAPWQARIPPLARVRATGAALGLLLGRRVLQRLLLPGSYSYWGWSKRGTLPAASGPKPTKPPYGDEAWEWLGFARYARSGM